MAKAKKNSTEPADKTAAKKPVKARNFSAMGNLGIDTDLAAQSAAKMLMKRSSGSPAPQGGTVKYLKDSIARPQSSSSIGNLLNIGGAAGLKNSNLPHMKQNQKGHNQTSTDASRTGVPRRTPG